MADKTIGELPGVTSLDSDSLFVAQQQGTASKVTGAQLIQFANVETATQVAAAQAAAQEAAASETAAETAKNGAETAQTAIENMTVEAETLAAGAQATVQKIVTSGQPIKLLFGLPTGPTGPAGGVDSFNGRAGDVMPQAGDYTAAMVGAAPEGFGLGNGCSKTYYNRPDEIKENGFFRTNVLGSILGPVFNEWSFGYHLEDIVDGANTYPAYQLFINQNGDSVVQRFRRSGVWSPFEWVNPPMQLGVEYRTTERYNGKPVYVKMVDCGVAPNATAKTVSVSSEADHIIRHTSELYFSSKFKGTIPQYATSEGVIKPNIATHVYGTNIYIYTSISTFYNNGYNVYCSVFYTKTTD